MLPATIPVHMLVVLALLALVLSACSISPYRASEHGGSELRLEAIEVKGRSYRYAVFLPAEYRSGQRWPAILFLHGRGESGTNGTRQLVVGLPKHAMWDSDAWPCIIIMPQKPDEDSQWEDHAEAVLEMLDRAEAEYSIDPARIVVTGLSQGGHGCWSLNAAAPGRFAALAPVCGYANLPLNGDRATWPFIADDGLSRGLIDAARGTPAWIFHGEADPVVPPEHSTGMASKLRQGGRGAEVRITMYPGVGHDSWDRAYSDPELRAWLLGARRTAP